MLPPDFQELWAKMIFFLFAFVMLTFGRIHASEISIEKGLLSSDGQEVLLNAIRSEFLKQDNKVVFRRIQCFKTGSLCILAYEKSNAAEKCVLNDVKVSSYDDLDDILTPKTYKKIKECL